MLLNTKDVLELTKLSRTTLHRLIKAEKFPSPTKLSKRINMWLEKDINMFIINTTKDSTHVNN